MNKYPVFEIRAEKPAIVKDKTIFYGSLQTFKEYIWNHSLIEYYEVIITVGRDQIQ